MTLPPIKLLNEISRWSALHLATRAGVPGSKATDPRHGSIDPTEAPIDPQGRTFHRERRARGCALLGAASACLMAFKLGVIFVCSLVALNAPVPGAQGGGIEQEHSQAQETLDPALAADLEAIDRKVAQIRDLTADFEERKITALLKNPLVSLGKLRIVGAQTRWDTTSPQPMTVVIDTTGIRIHYPQRSTLEVYQLDDKLKWLAVSPLPQLTKLLDRFTVERIPVAETGDADSSGSKLGLRLRPRDEAVGKYLRSVDALLNITTAFIVRVEMLDVDGDRTVILFSDIHANTGLDPEDVELAVPAGTQIVRPLAGFEGQSAGPSP